MRLAFSRENRDEDNFTGGSGELFSLGRRMQKEEGILKLNYFVFK